MMKIISSLLLFASLSDSSRDRFKPYRTVESYESQSGIQMVPVYSTNGVLCEISIEKRHSYNQRIDLNPTLTKDQILVLFDQLAPRGERGGPGWKLPEGTEFTEVDGGTRATHLTYENLALVMYGVEHSETYSAAVISWNRSECRRP